MNENDFLKDKMKEYSALIKYIERLDLIESSAIGLNTSIEEDLGLTGDDAIEFIDEFSDEFNVEIDSSFDYGKYFKPEGITFKPSKVEDFTIKNLLNAIITGKLE